MKVIVAVIFAVGSASAIGSGPYLPSDWRPKGPAFYLPSEIQPETPKPADNPVKETLLVEVEVSGSEGLREYGPPSESLNIQALPDAVTENTFYVVDSSAFVGKELDRVIEQKTEFIQEATTETQTTDAVEVKTLEGADITTASFDAVTDTVEAQVVTEGEVVTDKAEKVTEEVVAEIKEVLVAVDEKLENIVLREDVLENILVQNEANIAAGVEEAVEAPKNVAEALVKLENEIKTEQVQQSIQNVGELKVTEEGSVSAVPEGFLEYGPPGFREYGPPKGDELRSNAANEVRRRRFSPKFRSSQNKKH